jgi:hypothetical protein
MFRLDARSEGGTVREPYPVIIPESELQAFLHNHQANPHGWLGMHPAKVKRSSGVIVRAFRRNAVKCSVIDLEAKGREKKIYPMELLA